MEVKHSGPVNFTDSAAQKVGDLIEETGEEGVFLRVYVYGGGCSGLQYGVKFDTEALDDDYKIENNHQVLMIDSMSMDYLRGAEVDYVKDVEGERFVIRNPNAKTTCGCGMSFEAKDS